MLSENPPILRHNVSRFLLAKVPGKELPVISLRNKAEVLTLGFFGNGKVRLSGYGSNLFFSVLPKRKEKVRKGFSRDT